MADKVATWSLNLESNAKPVSAEAASGIEALRLQIERSQESIRGMVAAQRSLRGASDEVAKAKEGLKAKVEAERGAVSQANLALLKQGTTYEKLAADIRKASIEERKAESKRKTLEVKKLTEATKRLEESSAKWRKGVSAAGGPLESVTGKLEQLKGVLGGAGGTLGAMTLGIGLVIGAMVALGVAIVDAGVKLARFVIEAGNHNRTLGLFRQASAGGAQNARALGTWVDALSDKVATSRDRLNEMAVAITNKLSGGLSRLNGVSIRNLYEAIATASDLAPELASRIQEIGERGRRLNRMRLTPEDLDGLPVRFYEVAQALAKNVHVGVEEAKRALFEGRVGMQAGSEAIRDAVNAALGGINADRLKDADVQIDKMKENLGKLVDADVLEPLLTGMKDVLDEFKQGSETGEALRGIFRAVGEALGGVVKDNAADIARGVREIIQGFRTWVPIVLDVGKAILGNSYVLDGLKVAFYGVAGVIGIIATIALGVALTIGGVVKALKLMVDGVFALFDPNAWKSIGAFLIDGLWAGIKEGASKLLTGVKDIAGAIKDSFKHALGISSPSKVFAQYGRNTAAGYAEGLDQGAPQARSAAADLAPPAPVGGATGAGLMRRGGSTATVTFHFNLPQGASAKDSGEIAKAVTAPSILRELTRAIREGLITQGLPTQAPANG